MNKSILLSIGLPITIMSLTGRIATLELNTSDFVICRYHPQQSCISSRCRPGRVVAGERSAPIDL
ncbi:MAG: hypothetical protein RIC35_24280 [Marinoscillum sp.]